MMTRAIIMMMIMVVIMIMKMPIMPTEICLKLFCIPYQGWVVMAIIMIVIKVVITGTLL